MRPSRLGLAVVLGVAATLRFWALGDGVPHAIPPEENEIVGRALHMMRAGTLHPGFFEYGPLHVYIQFGVSILRFLFGAMSGEWRELAQVTSHPLFSWGRAAVAAFGVWTVFLVHQAGMRWGARHALLAAGLLAVLPLHVRYSQVVLPDVLAAFFVSLTLLLALKGIERPTIRALACAGAAAGLAASARYLGGLALVIPIAACWLSRATAIRLPATLAAIVAAAAAFVAASPYVVVDLPGFLDGFARGAARAREAAALEPGGPLVYLHTLQQQFALPGAAGPAVASAWPALALLGAGVLMGAVRSVKGPGRAGWALCLTYVALHSWVIATQPRPEARNLLPILPLLCIVVAASVISGVSLLRRYELSRPVRTALTAALTVLVLAPPAVTVVTSARTRSKTSTEELAYAWIRKNVPNDAVVVVEAGALTIPRDVVAGRGLAELRLTTFDDLAREGVHYAVASSNAYGRYLSAPLVYRDEYRAYVRLFSEATEVARFSPGPAHPGPELRVLKILP